MNRLQLFGQKWHEIPFTKGGEIGRTVDYSAGRNRYIGISDLPGSIFL